MVIENEIYKKNAEFLETVSKAKADSERKIAEALGFNNRGELRKKISLANRENRAILYELAMKMKEKGKSVSEIANELGRNESSVRLLLDHDFSEIAGEHGGITFEQMQKEMEEFRRTHDTIPIIVEVQRASLAERA